VTPTCACGRPIQPGRKYSCSYACAGDRVRTLATAQRAATAPQTTGLCECGCGQRTAMATATHRRRGNVAGFPQRFVFGHFRLLKETKSYRWRQGKYLHIVRAERALGKPLPPGAVVHHADGSKADDAPLVICQDQSYHLLLHLRMRIRAAGGNPDTDAVCGHCRTAKRRTEFSSDRSRVLHGIHGWCRSCTAAALRERRKSQRELLASVKKLRRALVVMGLDPVDANYTSILEQVDMAIARAEGVESPS
jgi:hypothetical protein